MPKAIYAKYPHWEGLRRQDLDPLTISQFVQDNLPYLAIPDGSGHYLKVPLLTTTQRDELTPSTGMIIFNTTKGKFEGYSSGTWGGFGGVTDHGDLTGLLDDDHTQYRLETEDHTHQSAGLQAGKLDHNLALTNVTADQHHARSHDHSLPADGSPVAEAGIPDHMSKSKLAWTADMLLKGAGDGVPPTEIPDYTQGARVYHSANQSIPNGTFTILAFDSEQYDTDNIHSNTTNNSRLTCKTAGKYLIIANIMWLYIGSPSGGRAVRLLLNGVGQYCGQETSAPVAWWGWEMLATTILSLSVNDYVEVTVSHNQGSAINIDHEGTFFAMHRIG